jgi:serine/threonine protein phosphatase PrpC
MRSVGAGSTSVGGRDHNEDTFLCQPSLGFFVVADGMGGHACGEVASDMVVRITSDFVETHRRSRDLRPKARLGRALEVASKQIFDRAEREPERNGMGSTGIAALVVRDKIYFAHVGDCRAYRLRKKELRQLTKDHSFVQELVDSGSITAEQARAHPKRNLITRSIGTEADAEVDVAVFRLRPGDRYLLCSDGLTGALEDQEIATFLGGRGTALRLADRLVAEAVDADADDNVTALIIDVPKPGVGRLAKAGALAGVGALVLAGAIVGYHSLSPTDSDDADQAEVRARDAGTNRNQQRKESDPGQGRAASATGGDPVRLRESSVEASQRNVAGGETRERSWDIPLTAHANQQSERQKPAGDEAANPEDVAAPPAELDIVAVPTIVADQVESSDLAASESKPPATMAPRDSADSANGQQAGDVTGAAALPTVTVDDTASREIESQPDTTSTDSSLQSASPDGEPVTIPDVPLDGPPEEGQDNDN